MYEILKYCETLNTDISIAKGNTLQEAIKNFEESNIKKEGIIWIRKK